MSVPVWTDVDWSTYVHHAEVAGSRVEYVDYGSGPPLLLVHGLGGRWATWIANIPALGEHYRVIAVDLPGFGGSEPLPVGAGFTAYVDVLEGLLDELGVPSVAVFGHSLGGLVSLTLAGTAPERVRCLVLVSGGGAPLTRLRLVAIQSIFRVLRLLFTAPWARWLLTRPTVSRTLLRPAVHDPRSIPDALIQVMVPSSITPGFLDAIRLGGAGLRSLDLAAVTAPALLVWGREDRILPLATAQELLAELPAACLVAIDRVGHCAMFEAPEEFERLAEDFLAQQGTDRGTPPRVRASARSWSGPFITELTDGSGRHGDEAAG